MEPSQGASPLTPRCGTVCAQAANYDPSATLALDPAVACIAPLPGCTDSLAANFRALANVDDGSCEYGGCTDSAAPNFAPLATFADGS